MSVAFELASGERNESIDRYDKVSNSRWICRPGAIGVTYSQ